MENPESYRHEYKYIISNVEAEKLIISMRTIIELDSNAREKGCYHIRSVYFDDYDNSCYWDNVNGVNERKKWRIRAYNNNSSRIQLECKHKTNGLTRKEACTISSDEYDALLRGMPVFSSERALVNKFSVEMIEKNMKPKVIVGYDRKPYVYPYGNVRVTLDYNIFSSQDINSMFSERLRKRLILPSGVQLLELKYDNYVPKFIADSFGEDRMKQETFSKYYLARKYYI